MWQLQTVVITVHRPLGYFFVLPGNLRIKETHPEKDKDYGMPGGDSDKKADWLLMESADMEHEEFGAQSESSFSNGSSINSIDS